MRRIKIISGDEYDALTKHGKDIHHWKSGQRSKTKREFRRRERHHAKLETPNEEMKDDTENDTAI